MGMKTRAQILESLKNLHLIDAIKRHVLPTDEDKNNHTKFFIIQKAVAITIKTVSIISIIIIYEIIIRHRLPQKHSTLIRNLNICLLFSNLIQSFLVSLSSIRFFHLNILLFLLDIVFGGIANFALAFVAVGNYGNIPEVYYRNCDRIKSIKNENKYNVSDFDCRYLMATPLNIATCVFSLLITVSCIVMMVMEGKKTYTGNKENLYHLKRLLRRHYPELDLSGYRISYDSSDDLRNSIKKSRIEYTTGDTSFLGRTSAIEVSESLSHLVKYNSSNRWKWAINNSEQEWTANKFFKTKSDELYDNKSKIEMQL
ncbi:hypothetical protein SNEBB_005944 [Seison nebaliae]|nr:hypothetical protein SNEBB_005944 [Seison nebaliae]